MSGDLLQTKLYVPRLRPSLIPRPHLLDRLNQGRQRKLTLISAPAGFGKTTLVTTWIAHQEQVAWLSLDEGDADPLRFLTYFIAALQTVLPDVGQEIMAVLRALQLPPIEKALTALLNELAAVPDPFLLVLDDYHVVDSPVVDQCLAFLLAHQPPQMHLVITTREDPTLPLARLRARGQMTELRAADLRFTLAEAESFLNQAMGLNLSAEDITALENRTEGWIAGLQLAALSLQKQANAHQFIAAFAGDNRYIVDYLADEILQRQPEPIRRFLLHTSILDRLNGSLCDAVTGRTDGKATLALLERSNLFIISLDEKRHWYRYHQLFADVLQAHLLLEQPETKADLHRRASTWYAQNGFTAAAVHHAFAAGDLDLAARMIELAWADMDRNRQAPEWLDWASQLPAELIAARPVLSVGLAWAYLDTGELEAADSWLRRAEQHLEIATDFIVADETEFQHLPGSIAAARTYHALALGDMVGTIQYAQQALRLFPEEEHLRRGTPGALLGLAYWAEGRLTAAQQAFTAAMSSYQKAGNILFVITGAYVLAEMSLAQGHLREAKKIYTDALALAQEQGEWVLRGAADLYTGLCELHLEQDQRAQAHKNLLDSKSLGEKAALSRWSFRWYVAQAKMKQAEGNLDEALAALDEAEREYVRGPVPDVRTIGGLKARIWVQQDRLDEAGRWATTEGLSISDELSYRREFEHITLARILFARYRRDGQENDLQEVLTLLARLLEAAAAGGRQGSMLEILILQALAHEDQGHHSTAAEILEQALVRAAPEGYMRLFMDEGPSMAALLQRLLAEDDRPAFSADKGVKAYGHRLLTALGAEKDTPPAPARAQPLVDPLSERELEVLQLVAQGLSNRQIADRLYLALSTVKGHNRNIYSKLQVSRRTEAVAQARELGLL